MITAALKLSGHACEMHLDLWGRPFDETGGFHPCTSTHHLMKCIMDVVDERPKVTSFSVHVGPGPKSFLAGGVVAEITAFLQGQLRRNASRPADLDVKVVSRA